MRIMIKGGVWKNTEDEILKAAVMKYGLNQWARISSLLVRKSAKQCKARWYEWLDPSIKKTEWSQEEDEKLLHLAKIMPCQWRSIAPIVGRTAAQCLERYEYLLDSVSHFNDNQSGADGSNQDEIDQQLLHRSSHLSTSNLRRLRPGEIDPNPETKPARPDAIDMDEDEKEMLSEARARLANTKGKKAKRKAREKQLEEARRLASLQKRRELKAAGIHLRRRRKKRFKYLDYNNEIPFYRQTPRGFWDTSNDDMKAKQITDKARNDFKPMFITEIEGERRDDIEERERKKDIQRQKLLKKINLPELIERLNKHDQNQYIPQRKQLNLPQPQISENELEDIAKLSKSSASTHNSLASLSVMNTNAAAATTPSAADALDTVSRNASDIRTPSTHDRIIQQATNALRMQNTQTPLLGGDNVELYKQDWNGVTPKRQSMQTPNINTPMIADNTRSKSMAVDHGASVGSVMSNVSSMSAMSDRKKKKKEKRKKKRLREEFENLPKALYDYQVALPTMPHKPYQSDKLWIEDRADRDAQRVREDEMEYERQKKKQTLVIQQGLPRPQHLNSEMKLDFEVFGDKVAALNEAEHLLRKEMMDLIYFDMNNAPLSGEQQPRKKRKKLIVRREEFDDEQLLNAQKLLQTEMEVQRQHHGKVGVDAMSEMQREDEQCLYVPELQRYRYLGNSRHTKEDRLTSKKQEFTVLHQQIMAEQSKMDEIQKKMEIMMGGYHKVGTDLMVKNVTLRRKLTEAEQQMRVFGEMKEREMKVIPQRIRKWKQWISTEKERQHKLQNEYERLSNERETLLNE